MSALPIALGILSTYLVTPKGLAVTGLRRLVWSPNQPKARSRPEPRRRHNLGELTSLHPILPKPKVAAGEVRKEDAPAPAFQPPRHPPCMPPAAVSDPRSPPGCPLAPWGARGTPMNRRGLPESPGLESTHAHTPARTHTQLCSQCISSPCLGVRRGLLTRELECPGQHGRHGGGPGARARARRRAV